MIAKTTGVSSKLTTGDAESLSMDESNNVESTGRASFFPSPPPTRVGECDASPLLIKPKLVPSQFGYSYLL